MNSVQLNIYRAVESGKINPGIGGMATWGGGDSPCHLSLSLCRSIIKVDWIYCPSFRFDVRLLLTSPPRYKLSFEAFR